MIAWVIYGKALILFYFFHSVVYIFLKITLYSVLHNRDYGTNKVKATHYSLKSVSLKLPLVWEWWVVYTFQRWGVGADKELLISWVPLTCQLAVMSSR